MSFAAQQTFGNTSLELSAVQVWIFFGFYLDCALQDSLN